nr:chlorophyll a/b-binding protein [Chamaesiphon sp. VAR_48_metabat_403]
MSLYRRLRNFTPPKSKPMQAKKEEPKVGFVPSSELLNGRLAMLGFVAAVVTELVTGQGTLHFLGLM